MHVSHQSGAPVYAEITISSEGFAVASSTVATVLSEAQVDTAIKHAAARQERRRLERLEAEEE